MRFDKVMRRWTVHPNAYRNAQRRRQCLLCSAYHALAPEIPAGAENLAAPFGAVPIHGKAVWMSRPSALTPHRFRGRIGAWKPDTSPAGALPLFGYRHGVYGRMRHGDSTFALLFGNCVSTLNIFRSILFLPSHIAGPWHAFVHACRKLDGSRPRGHHRNPVRTFASRCCDGTTPALPSTAAIRGRPALRSRPVSAR